MARRIAIFGLFVALASLATGCHHFCHKHKHFKHHDYADPCSCACSSSASIEPPIYPAEQLPAPKRMPTTTMTPSPLLTGYVK